MSHVKRNVLILAFAGAAGYAFWGGGLNRVAATFGGDDSSQTISQSTSISCDSSEGFHADIVFDKAARKLSVESEGQKATVTVPSLVGSISANHLVSGGGTWTCKDAQGKLLGDAVRFKF